MSAVRIGTVAASSVLTPLDHTTVTAVLATDLVLMDAHAMVQYSGCMIPSKKKRLIHKMSFIQILMSVLRVQTTVLRYAQTQLGATHAPVSQATVWQVMDECVVVRHKCTVVSWVSTHGHLFNNAQFLHTWVPTQDGNTCIDS